MKTKINWRKVELELDELLVSNNIDLQFPEHIRKDLGKFYAESIQHHVKLYVSIINENKY